MHERWLYYQIHYITYAFTKCWSNLFPPFLYSPMIILNTQPLNQDLSSPPSTELPLCIILVHTFLTRDCGAYCNQDLSSPPSLTELRFALFRFTRSWRGTVEYPVGSMHFCYTDIVQRVVSLVKIIPLDRDRTQWCDTAKFKTVRCSGKLIRSVARREESKICQTWA